MRLLILSLTLFASLFVAAFAEVMRGHLTLLSDKTLSSGEMVKGEIVFYPVVDFDGLKRALENSLMKPIIKPLYLYKIDKLARSPQNYDATVFEARFIVKEGFKKEEKYVATLNSEYVTITINEGEAQGLKQKLKEYIVLNIPTLKERVLIYALPLLVILLFGIFFKKRATKRRAVLTSKWDGLVDRSKVSINRELAEEFYLNRKEFSAHVTPELFQEFASMLNKIQYKKEWSEMEMDDVRRIIDRLILEYKRE